MRRPLVRDLSSAQRAGDGTPAGTEVALFANLCEVAPDVLDKMDLGDYQELQEAYDGFLVPRVNLPGGRAPAPKKSP